MSPAYHTSRLNLSALTPADATFIRELVNTPGWLRFIGDRNVITDDDAQRYVEKIIANPDVTYWVVRLRESATPIGVVTLLRRDYLPHPDLGFAFLPTYVGQGYAYEAAQAVVADVLSGGRHLALLAITDPDNVTSIGLLIRLGFRFDRELDRHGERLRVYSLTASDHQIQRQHAQ